MSNKSKIKKIVIIVIVVLFGTVVFFVWRKNLPNAENRFPKISLKESQIYKDAKYNFSFEYPDQFKIGAFDENDNRTVLIQKSGSGDSLKGAQIYIQPFNENIAMTKERIQKDLPEKIVENYFSIQIAEAVDGLTFESSEPNFGRTFEIWFVYNGQLYQIMAKAENKELTEKIIKKWKF